MDQPAREPSLSSIVESIDGRDVFETDRLVARLWRSCWPGGSDRTEPGAIEWVKRWGPSRITEQPFECSCVQGRCAVCN